LSATAVKVRNLAKLANDPNKFLLDDIPAAFGEQTPADTDRIGDSMPIIKAVRSGLDELVGAYPRMLRELAATMLHELRMPRATEVEMIELHLRAETVRGLTGNYRLDAFATRLITYAGTEEEIEGIASLAANKPPRDWVDRDIDHARIEIAALAQDFVRAEGLAHVKGRGDRRHAMAMIFGDPLRQSPITREFDIAVHQQPEVNLLVSDLRAVINKANPSRDIALAALAELGTELAEALSTVTPVVGERVLKRQRVG